MENGHPSDDELRLYLAEKLSPAILERVEAHLQACQEMGGSCLHRLDELGRSSVSSEGTGADISPVPPDLSDFGYTYERETSGAVRTPPGVSACHEVYLAYRKRDGLPVVIKFLRDGDFRGISAERLETARLRFIQEAGATHQLHQLKNAGIVPVFDFQSVAGRFFYVMEYVGPSLNQYQFGTPFWAKVDRPAAVPAVNDELITMTYRPTEGMAASTVPAAPAPILGHHADDLRNRFDTLALLLIDVARTLQKVHNAGILHRDLKPGNLLIRLNADRQPEKFLIADFGILHHLNLRASAVEEGTIGTLSYLAPEQLDNKQELSPATDLYGLGGVLYFMLTGQHPVVLTPEEDFATTIRTVPPTPPSEFQPRIPTGLEAVCLKALKKDPRRRYQTASEFAEDLERFRAGQTPRAIRYPWWERARDWARQNPRPAAAFLALSVMLCLSIGAVGVALWQKGVAEQAQQEAQINAAKEKQQARDNLRQAARFALARGQRLAALAFYDRLLADAPADDHASLRVERLPTLFLEEHWPRLRTELEELAVADLPNPLRAQVLMHRGDVGLWQIDVKPQTAARKTLEEALRLPNGLGPAHTAYARGLLTDSVFKAVEHFEEALHHDAFHARARMALLLELVLSGQFAAAQRHVDWGAVAFPEDPTVPLAGAIMGALEAKPLAAQHHRARLRQILTKERFFQVDQVLKSLAKINQNEQAAAFLILANLPVATQLMPLRELGPAMGLATPVLQRPFQLVVDLKNMHDRMFWIKLGLGDPDALCKHCEKIEAKHPEALVRYGHAFGRLASSDRHLKASRFDRAYQEMKRADQLAQEVSQCPTVLPTQAFRRDIDWLRIVLQASWTAQRQHFTTLAAASLLYRPDLPGATVFNPLGGLIVNMEAMRDLPTAYDRNLVFRVAANSNGHNAGRTELLPSTLRNLPVEDGRLLLSDWEADEPGDLLPLALRAKFETRHDNRIMALAYVRRVLERRPADSEMLKLRELLSNE